ncbi:MAG: glycosyltransferase family 1 protein [Acidobacteria bacterium]|nr:glycosyltransferase family 1 protein [Acidobacteriota bacterium]
MTPPNPTIALDATYAADPQPTGIGIYSAQLIAALGAMIRSQERNAHRVVLGFRPGPFVRHAWRQNWPPEFRIAPLMDQWITLPRADLFHGLNQRLPERSYARTVVTLHERYPSVSDEYSTTAFRSHMGGRIESALTRADRIIAVSRAVQDHLAEHRPRLAKKIRVVHHGVAVAEKVTDAERTAILSHRLCIAPGEPFFLNVGAVQIRKNLKNLIMALKPLKDIRLVVVGADGFGAPEIREFVQRENLSGRVQFAGHMQPEELNVLYASATALVFPSLEEAFGMPILEAMRCGCPVITSNVAAMPEVAGDAALLIDPHNVEQLSAAMQRVISDQSLAASLRQQGLRRAALFSWEKCARETWAVYEELLATQENMDRV